EVHEPHAGAPLGVSLRRRLLERLEGRIVLTGRERRAAILEIVGKTGGVPAYRGHQDQGGHEPKGSGTSVVGVHGVGIESPREWVLSIGERRTNRTGTVVGTSPASRT